MQTCNSGRKCNYKAHWVNSKPPLQNRGKYTKMARMADALMLTTLQIVYHLVDHQKCAWVIESPVGFLAC